MGKIVKWILVLFVFILIASGRIESSDGLSALNVARNIVCCGSFNIAPPQYSGGLQTTIGRDGQYYSPTSLGSSLLYLPAAHITKTIYSFNHFEQGKYFPLQIDYLLTFLASFTNPILALLLFIVNYRIFKLFTKKDSSAFFLSLIISFATNLLPLAKHSFFHIPFSFFLGLSFYYLILFFEKEKKEKYLGLSGLYFGLAALSYNLIFIVVLLAYLTLIFLKTKNKLYLVRWLGSVLPFFIIIGIYNLVRFNNPFIVGYDLNAFDLSTLGNPLKGIFGLLLSPGKSMLLYSPILILSYILAFKTFKKDYLSKFFIFFTLVILLSYGSFVFWSGDLAWGPRYMSVLIPFGGVILARNWQKINKAFLYFLLVIGLFIQLEGVVIPYEYQYPYNSMVFKQKITDRHSQFEYWSIGHFNPRYSPIYTMKKEVVKRLINIPQVFPSRSNIIFAYGASRHYKSSLGYYKIGRSLLYLYSKKDIKIPSITFTAKKMKGNDLIAGAIICSKEICTESISITQKEDEYKIIFEKPLAISKNNYIKINLIPDNPVVEDFEYHFDKFILGEESIDLKDFRVFIQDHFFSRSAPYDYNGQEYYRYNDQKFKLDESINTVADFWWLHPFIFYNILSRT